MPTTPLTTWNDASNRVLDYLGENATKLAVRDAKRTVLDAYRELATAHRWSYFYNSLRIDTVASYTTGTVSYTHTGGAFERLVTLTSGTWPSWAANGKIVINSIVYEVATRESNTQLTLSVNKNPGANVAAGTSYTLYRDTFPLPVDFVSADEFVNGTNNAELEYVHPSHWHRRQHTAPHVATPTQYTFMGSNDHLGAMAVAFYPPPDAAYALDAVYQRRPRPLLVEDYHAGTVTNTANSTTITGTGTTFTSGHVGSVIRLSANNVDLPTPLWGANPYVQERMITGFTNATTITVDSAIATAYTGVKYLISDPLDIEEGAMMTALWRCLEKQGTIARIMKNQMEAERAWLQALLAAREADSRNFARRVAGGEVAYLRLRDFPRGADVS